ncbi:hypothetical protein Droror1_Dr00026919, partial [Drosera rotundifolia]
MIQVKKVEILGSGVWFLLEFVELQPVEDVVSWSSMVVTFGKKGEYSSLRRRTAGSYSVDGCVKICAIEGEFYLRLGKLEKRRQARNLFECIIAAAGLQLSQWPEICVGRFIPVWYFCCCVNSGWNRGSMDLKCEVEVCDGVGVGANSTDAIRRVAVKATFVAMVARSIEDFGSNGRKMSGLRARQWRPCSCLIFYSTHGVPLSITKGGKTWTPDKAADSIAANLYSVKFIDDKTCFMLGNDGVLLRYLGYNMVLPMNIGAEVAMASDKDHAGLCNGGLNVDSVYRVYRILQESKSLSGSLFCGGSGVPLRITKGGNTWTPDKAPDSIAANLYSIKFINDKTCFMLGNDGVLLRYLGYYLVLAMNIGAKVAMVSDKDHAGLCNGGLNVDSVYRGGRLCWSGIVVGKGGWLCDRGGGDGGGVAVGEREEERKRGEGRGSRRRRRQAATVAAG